MQYASCNNVSCISIFSKIELVDQLEIKKKSRPSDMHYPITDIQTKFEINGLLGIELPRKYIISTNNRRTDRQTDGRQTTIDIKK